MLPFTARDPVGPCRVAVGARRSRHVRFEVLDDPEQVPLGTECAAVTIVVQHTRVGSRHAENALLSTAGNPA